MGATDAAGYGDWADPETNLLDALDAALAERGLADEVVALVAHRTGEGDARLRPRGAPLAGRLDALPGLAELEPEGEGLRVRFDDERLAALGAQLEAGAEEALATAALAPGERWTVSFVDPNTNKALHVGHLRNVALGHGLASLAEAAGIAVTRQVREGDFGRSMGEALAGVLAHGGDHADGVKGDRFVGECYARYVQGLDGRRAASGADAALAREQEVRYDDADRLLSAWRAGDPQARTLFERVRGWVLEGHEATLARLGIAIDRTLCESDFLAAAERVAEEGVARGILEREPGGAVVYDTGEERFPRLLLARPDGFPTQHLRHVGAWHELQDDYDGERTIVVVGEEWGPLGRYAREILARLGDGEEPHPLVTVTHGLVQAGRGRVTSGDGTALLIDDLLDALEAAAREPHGEPGATAAIVALGWFLGQPMGKPATLTLGDLLDARKSIGRAMAGAWARAWDPAYDGAPDPRPREDAYRYAVVHAQRHRRLLGKCLDELDPLALVRFHFHLASWFEQLAPAPPVARVMRTVLGAGLGALGLAAASPRPGAAALA